MFPGRPGWPLPCWLCALGGGAVDSGAHVPAMAGRCVSSMHEAASRLCGVGVRGGGERP